jgi:hypothetical protein
VASQTCGSPSGGLLLSRGPLAANLHRLPRTSANSFRAALVLLVSLCIRLATASIDWLAARIGLGTPVTIDAE